jgi:hypothetical protein
MHILDEPSDPIDFGFAPNKSVGLELLFSDPHSFFRASVQFIIVGEGSSVKFWTDPWLEGVAIADLAPELLAAVPRRWQQLRRVAEAMQNNS